MKRWMLLLTAVLLMLSLACSTLGKKEPATEEPTTEATEESSAEGTRESAGETEEAPSEGATDTPADEGVFEADRNALDELDSYRAELTMRTEKVDGTVEEMTMRQEATRDPRAERYVVEGDTGAFEMILAPGAGEEAIVADAVEPARQGVEKKATDELGSVEMHDLLL